MEHSFIFSGSFCEIKLDQCLSEPCLNGGYCQSLTNEYECQCLPGFSGLNCEVGVHCTDTRAQCPKIQQKCYLGESELLKY